MTTSPVRIFRRPKKLGFYLFLIPAFVTFTLVIFVPFILNIYYSFLSWQGGLAPKTFIGLQNYVDLLKDENFWTSFRNTGLVVIAIVIVPTVVGLVIAAVLFDYIGREFGPQAASFLRASFYLPQILPIAVAGVVWGWILNVQGGAANSLLSAIGVSDPPNWLGSTQWAMPAVMLVLIWGQIGFPVVIFMAALQRVDPALYEAASLDGAGWGARFRHITVPQIRPEVFVVSITATIGALKVFGPIAVLTSGGPESSTYVPSYYAFFSFFTLSKVGYGAAIATVLTILTVIIAVILIIVQSRTTQDEED